MTASKTEQNGYCDRCDFAFPLTELRPQPPPAPDGAKIVCKKCYDKPVYSPKGLKK